MRRSITLLASPSYAKSKGFFFAMKKTNAKAMPQVAEEMNVNGTVTKLVGSAKLQESALSDEKEPMQKTSSDAVDRVKSVFNIRQRPKSLFIQEMYSTSLTENTLTYKAKHDEEVYRKRKLLERGMLNSNDDVGGEDVNAQERKMVAENTDRRQQEEQSRTPESGIKQKHSETKTTKEAKATAETTIPLHKTTPYLRGDDNNTAAVTASTTKVANSKDSEAREKELSRKSETEVREYYWVVISALAGYLAAHFLVFHMYYPNDLRLSYAPDKGYTDDVAAQRDQLKQLDELIEITVLNSVYDSKRAAAKRVLNATA